MKLMNLLWALGVLVSASTSEKSCYWNSNCDEKLYATRTPYDAIRGDIRDWPVPTGCETICIWALTRHGNRNPSDSITSSMRELQSRIKNDIIQNFHNDMENSQLCAQDVYDLRQWTWNSTMDTAGSYLTGVGYEEIYDLAVRLVQKYPLLFHQPFDGYVRPTNKQRTITSAIAFVHGITDEAKELNLTVTDPDVVFDILRPYDHCEVYTNEVRNGQVLADQLEEFFKTSEYLQVKERVTQRLGVSEELSVEEVFTLYEMCRFYRTWSPQHKSPWCAAFSSEDLIVLEYRDDVRHYYRNSYGFPINAKLAGLVLNDLYINMKSAKNGDGLDLVAYFAHDTLLGMVHSALGLNKDNEPLTSQHRDPNRLWRTSYVAPFTSNIMTFLNKCGDEYKVQIFINEKPTALCPLEGCTWSQFVSIFEPFTNASMDFCNSRDSSPPTPGDAVGLKAFRSFLILSFSIIILQR